MLFTAELPAVLSGRMAFDIWSTLIIIFSYGAFFALILSIIIVLIWFVLASRKTTVVFPVAIVVGGGLVGAGSAALFGPLGLLFGIFFGAFAGAHFWYWAFGTGWSVQMQLKQQEN